jgi:two-component sensor histidine kinase
MRTLLSQSRWSDVGLANLIREQLAPYTTDATATISGPDVMLTSAQTQTVAMVCHELVTNAAKHGALSSSHGKVSVSWHRTGGECSGDPDDHVVRAWRATDRRAGPPWLRQGPHTRSHPHELEGTVDLTFASDGLSCKIEIPLRAKHRGR